MSSSFTTWDTTKRSSGVAGGDGDMSARLQETGAAAVYVLAAARFAPAGVPASKALLELVG